VTLKRGRLFPTRGFLPLVFGIILVLMGGAVAIGGFRLADLSGSWYYLIAGVVLVNTGALYVVRNRAASGLYFLLLLATVVWAIAEVGFRSGASCRGSLCSWC
jgi:glucose dehydrogenase